MTRADRILICDDDAWSVRALRVTLRDAGYLVEAAASSGEALDAAARRMPDAAIVELVLPDADGIEVCRQLRERSTIALIVLSAIDDEHEKVRALNAGADDYLTKPFASRELVARIRAIRRRSQRNTVCRHAECCAPEGAAASNGVSNEPGIADG